ncbi:multidrug resistance-associated ABC transporter [Mycena alexandri]|uniref:Multidrug resistance-associated ABC transporter n=1 Tax=Mycena alexandri TaxID=1745969 RepID=A0AAD6TFI6_9AGAR|nr:multidrug resistance-associated ABC transporter [Mycena alexandri]
MPDLNPRSLTSLGSDMDLLAVPVIASTLSAMVLGAHVIFRPANKRYRGAKKQNRLLDIGRLVSCLTLLVLLTRDETWSRGSSVNLEVNPSATYIYVSMLALVSILGQPPISDNAASHLTVVLISTLAVYLYRDVLPLGTVFDTPKDSSEGIRLWLKICLLAFAGCLVPLLTPRRYSPVNPLNPVDVPNPEQTASILSLALYTFLDDTIFLAHRLGRLPYDLFPPLADYDSAEYLRSQNFQQGRHLFFGIIRIFRFDIFVLGVTSAVIVLGRLVAPVGLNRLLHYIETQGEGETYRPWVWVLWLFLGPTIHSLGDHWYMYIASRIGVRTEAILTELIFEHALRMRIKSEPSAKGRNSPGKLNLNNMITTDIRIIIGSKRLLLSLVYMPLMFILSIWFLYAILGWSTFVGLATIFAMLPVPGYLGKWVQTAQRGLARNRDARVQSVTETINLLRMIKFFGWETKMSAEVAAKRQMELVCLWKRKLLDLVNGCINILLPIATKLTTYAAYVVIMRQPLTASKVFSSMTVFDVLKTSVESILSSYTQFLTSKVSFDRIDSFLRKTELLDVNSSEVKSVVPPEHRDEIGIHNATFSCGKTSLLLSLLGFPPYFLVDAYYSYLPLGETYFTSSQDPESWYNLPRDGGVAYAAQESWVQSATIKACSENILFGAEFDSERYRKVLHQCCLERDLELFASGDEQVVGERGLTLSGGQKARVTLARAIVHSAKWIVEKCFAGDLIAGRTVLLVTRNIALTRSISQFAVSLGLDGRVMSQGTIHDALKVNEKLSIEASDDQARLESAPDEINTFDISDKKSSTSGKLIMPEEIVQGNVGWSPVRLYLRSLGGTHPHLFFLALLAGFVLQNSAGNLQTWYLGYWSSQYDTKPASEVRVLYHLSVYGSILLLLFLFYACGFLVYTFGILRASETLHQQLIDSVLGTTLRWLDTTPTSRIIARATQDMGMVDGPPTASLRSLLDHTVSMAVTLSAIVLFTTPIFFAPGVTLFLLGSYCGRLFMPARISVKREMSNARSPILGHFSAAVTGLISIRAYACQDAFIHESLRRLNRYTRTARLSFDLTRWSAIRTEMLGNVFVASLAAYLVYFKNYNAANTGFTLQAAVRFGETVTSWILGLNDFELMCECYRGYRILPFNRIVARFTANSLERIEAYINIEQEPKPTMSGIPPAAWPTSGELVVRNLSVRYSDDGPDVLHDISFSVKSGERIGVGEDLDDLSFDPTADRYYQVGRTGAGKSSLTLALLRAIPTKGSVSYGGITTSSVNLDALRSKITIIPQMPELLSGTLRQNLDPFGQFGDAELDTALHTAGLSSLQAEAAESNITLETVISSGGNNLSVGQRQVIALARAMVCQSKLLILDEDYKTDAVIQDSLRTRLGSDVTLITVAHRLQSIMNADRIVCLNVPITE